MTRKHNYKNGQLRLRGWDYSNEGAYFITFNTKDKQAFFGVVENGNMILNDLGSMVFELWKLIPKKFDFIELGEFVVMPNHIHGILIIHSKSDERIGIEGSVGFREPGKIMGTEEIVGSRLIATPLASQPTSTSVNNTTSGGITGFHNPMLQQNLSRALRWYKGRCTFELRKLQPDFEWQTRFYDHIIRNSDAYERITIYIRNNPRNWKQKRLPSN